MSFWILLVFVVGWLVGYVHGHVVIANECEKLGTFYVGSRIYVCRKIKDVESDNER